MIWVSIFAFCILVYLLEYRKRGFQEVITPNMYNKDLWETSGHWV
jgi:threonyl-tRNA synthetase